MARKTKQEALETRESILDAAERLFHSQGVSRTSLQDIAAAAQLTRGAIYWHFKDKAELFNAMMERATMPLEQGMTASVVPEPGAAPVPTLAELRWGLVNVFYSAMHSERTRRAFEIVMHKVEFAGEMSSLRERQLDAHTQWREQNRGCFEAAVARGELPASVDPMQAAIELIALTDGLIHEWILAPQSFDLVHVGQAAVERFFNCLAGRPLLPQLSAAEVERLGRTPICPVARGSAEPA
jgi:TetR/AcrR family acrAB operon transcriptional repressor